MNWTAVIPSARAENLLRSARVLFDRHPWIHANHVVVVDDGARAGAGRFLRPGTTWVSGVKPFVYSRNVNIGVAKAWEMGSDCVVIMGDDVLMLTSGGLDLMARQLLERPELGIVSAAIVGMPGNASQWFDPSPGAVPFRGEPSHLCFNCVMIPRRVWEKVGVMDERFVGYGYEDNDYSVRVRQAGYTLGILNTCVVNHMDVPSTFRSVEYLQKFEENRVLYLKKWG